MPTDTVDLIQKVHDVFAGAYAKIASDEAFLAFEPMGIPLPDGMFKLDAASAYCPPLAVERLSEIANKVPLVLNGAITRGMNTVESVTSLLLTASTPLNADAMVTLGAVKRDAGKNFDIVLASLSGIPNDDFRPVYASPPDWYLAGTPGNWTPHTVGDMPPVAPPPAGRPAPPNTLDWKVLPVDKQPALQTPIVVGHPLLPRPANTVLTHPPIVRSALTVSATAMPRQVLAMANAISANSAISSAAVTARPMIRPMELVATTQNLAASTTAQAVTTDKIGMSFEHCLVMLTRPWFPEPLLLLRNWYLPGYAAGEISGGKGVGDTGLMPVLTTGFIVIRNLTITSKWSASDLAVVQGAASFGPFSLIGRSYDQQTGTLSSPGMQIIGWFCSALPVLPPAGDPAALAKP